MTRGHPPGDLPVVLARHADESTSSSRESVGMLHSVRSRHVSCFGILYYRMRLAHDAVPLDSLGDLRGPKGEDHSNKPCKARGRDSVRP